MMNNELRIDGSSPMDVVGMGMVTQTEMSKVITKPSINKTLKKTTGGERRKILSDRDYMALIP